MPDGSLKHVIPEPESGIVRPHEVEASVAFVPRAVKLP